VNRSLLQTLTIGLIALLLGVAGTAAVMASIPGSGSPPSIFDDFNWNSTANGFWHVYSDGGTATIKDGMLTLTGHTIELDRRVQTDPYATYMTVRVRARHFYKFGFGLAVYHAGSIGIEFDNDGVKCGRGTDHGYKTDVFKTWTPDTAPVDQWLYVRLKVVDPYPNPTPAELERISNLDASQLKPVTEICSVYDSTGHLLGETNANDPVPNTHYVGLDEAYMRTWDSSNDYQVDWVYVGSDAGDPIHGVVRTS
jgi:hypothetical protein